MAETIPAALNMFQHTGRYIKRRPMKEMMMFKRSVIAMACIFPLSACGGGGGGSPDVKSADTPSKPAAPVVAENAGEGVLPKEKKDEEAAGGVPQADTQDATAGEGSQDMAAVSAENTGNGGAATTDNPKNEDAGAQNRYAAKCRRIRKSNREQPTRRFFRFRPRVKPCPCEWR